MLGDLVLETGAGAVVVRNLKVQLLTLLRPVQLGVLGFLLLNLVFQLENVVLLTDRVVSEVIVHFFAEALV